MKNRAAPIGVELLVGDVCTLDLSDPGLFAVYVQNPNNNGAIIDYTSYIETAHANGVYIVMGADLMSLLLVKTPGEMGADVGGGTRANGLAFRWVLADPMPFLRDEG